MWRNVDCCHHRQGCPRSGAASFFETLLLLCPCTGGHIPEVWPSCCHVLSKTWQSLIGLISWAGTRVLWRYEPSNQRVAWDKKITAWIFVMFSSLRSCVSWYIRICKHVFNYPEDGSGNYSKTLVTVNRHAVGSAPVRTPAVCHLYTNLGVRCSGQWAVTRTEILVSNVRMLPSAGFSFSEAVFSTSLFWRTPLTVHTDTGFTE
jgi:hypothetical protein